MMVTDDVNLSNKIPKKDIESNNQGFTRRCDRKVRNLLNKSFVENSSSFKSIESFPCKKSTELYVLQILLAGCYVDVVEKKILMKIATAKF